MANSFGLTYSTNTNQPDFLLRAPAETPFSTFYAPPASPATTSVAREESVNSQAALPSTSGGQTGNFRVPVFPQAASVVSSPVPASVQPQSAAASFNNALGQGPIIAGRYVQPSPLYPYGNLIQQGGYISSPQRLNFYGSDNTRSPFL